MLKAFDKNITERAMVMARETLEIEVDAMRALGTRLAADDSVAAILRPMCPDLPMPETTTRPVPA